MKTCKNDDCLEPVHGRSGMCKEHKAEYNRAWYEKNKEKHKARAREINKERSVFFYKMIAAQKNQPCADCKETYPPYVMDFDHLDGADKVSDIAKMVGWNMQKIAAEIVKCEVVCANCHRERTHQRRQAQKGKA